ncbi:MULTISPECIES: transglutaminase-like cysteine peptidase [unclassified Bradyrhizobium]|uniref:transglutaminase-like cysteine peptidase n=1 Tax=unclassified Bradyrhizobium TaxID=2631580 RepID=UPI002478A540|nr:MULTISPECIES: transglutaminase-like cysteine peptidase [unclassified Bradyrhizobium]WGR71000.1 transglutaminase-like cysteine peptidase [Bradyrhizobium sp. ISRA426]WGR75838.1 transglutaminase-like cysteine peptidase [Bradyrhizobium sp. ISRA430]WGR86241.1 transglutaminase-like cysteine peptidase [Bradyrhizobium sp. ISRA432]
METTARRRAWRAILVLCGLSLLGPNAELRAGTLLSPGSAVLVRKSAEPFGVFAFAISTGSLRQKWSALKDKIDDDMVQLALCDGDRDNCASPAALKLLAIVDRARARDGRARLGETNRAINLAIKAANDGAEDVWSSPLATFQRGTGDCEDYAIAKLAALRLAGVAAEDLRIVVVRDTHSGAEHAVAAARLDGRWLMLDNRRMAMVEDEDARSYQPLFVLYRSAVLKYVDEPVRVSLVAVSAAMH